MTGRVFDSMRWEDICESLNPILIDLRGTKLEQLNVGWKVFTSGGSVKRSRRILIVDDDGVTCELLKKTLSEGPYEVEATYNSAEGLKERLENFSPDLIITEAGDSSKHPFEQVQTLKAHDNTKQIKVIICSAKASQSDIKQGLAAGADKYITKPFEPGDIVATVNALFGKEILGEGPGTHYGQEEMGTSEKSWVDFRRAVTEVGEEKRRYPRLEFHCPVKIEGIKGVNRVTDISMGGVFIECEHPLTVEEGQTLHLTIKLPTEYGPIKVEAEVANLRERGIGVKFLNLTQKNKDVIRFCFNTFKDTLPLR